VKIADKLIESLFDKEHSSGSLEDLIKTEARKTRRAIWIAAAAIILAIFIAPVFVTFAKWVLIILCVAFAVSVFILLAPKLREILGKKKQKVEKNSGFSDVM
jgi:uncharacterized membrane protein YdbT with pleckstrin-like domain